MIDTPQNLSAAPATDRNLPTPAVGTIGRIKGAFRGDGLKAKALRGSAWTMAGYAASQVIRLGSNLILTRLLFPEAFGLMALVNVFMQGLQMFSDVGIGPSIIQNKRGDDPTFLNTAWTIQIIRGFALWLVSCAIAWPVAKFYGEPMLLMLIPVAGLGALVSGFRTTALFTANRKLNLARITMFNLISQVLNMGIMVGWAYLHPSVWALAGSGVISGLIMTSLSFRFLPTHRHKFSWEQDAKTELFKFGRWVFVGTILTFLANQGDRLIYGKLLTMQELGVLGLAVMLARLPNDVLRQVGDSVLFPVLSKVQNDSPEAFRKKLSAARLPLVAGSFFSSLALMVIGPWLVKVLYPVSFKDAGWMIPLIALGTMLDGISLSYSRAFLAKGRSDYSTIAQFFSIIFRFTGLAIGYSTGGLHGALIGYSLGMWAVYGVVASNAWKLSLLDLRVDLFFTLMGITLTLILYEFGIGFHLP